MGRKRKGPWLREEDNSYYTTINRKNVKICAADEPWEEVERQYHALLANEAERPSIWTVAALVDEFLEDCKRRKSERTYEWYRRYLKEFADTIGTRLRIDNLTPYTVTNWVEGRYRDCSANTKHAATRTIVRLCNWAVKARLIKSSPIVGIEKPTPQPRETHITPQEYQSLLEHCKPAGRDVVQFLWNTGCRPQELRAIEARHIDGPKVVLDRQESKGKRAKRVIYLNEVALEIVNRLAAENPSGKLFRNGKGNPWTKDALICLFKRFRDKTGIKNLSPYTLRHSYATEMLKRDCDTTTLGLLMGTSPAMIAKTYQHLMKDDDYMLRAAAKYVETAPAAGEQPTSADVGSRQAAAG